MFFLVLRVYTYCYQFNEVKIYLLILQSLHLKFTNINWLEVTKSNDLLRQRQFLERAVANLEHRKAIAIERQNPLQFNIIEENQSLLLVVNKLRKEAKTNQSKYKELQCLIKEKNRRLASVKNANSEEESFKSLNKNLEE